tara:strand:- start:33 stop:671 length:639 start_codon:yes stop_codon:yes gene_type:complete
MKVLVACEESQVVAKAFRELGHQSYSCDILDCTGGYPEIHIKGDAIKEAYSGKYDLIIAHPPCTYMSKAGARFMYPTAGNIDNDRLKLALEAKEFFINLYNAPCKYIAVENPTPLKCVELPIHSQVIQPYQFGHAFSKRTLLWLKNLPPLEYTNVLTDWKPYMPSNTGGKKRGQSYNRGTARNATEASKTFKGIAEAMAKQWTKFIIKNEEI